MDYEYNKLYFDPIPEKSFGGGLAAIICGFFMLMAGIGIDLEVGGKAALIIFGLGFMVLGVYLTIRTSNFNKSRMIVTDEDIDRVRSEHLKNLKSMAIKKLGIDEEQVNEANPIIFHYYDHNILLESSACSKKGDDGIWRFSNYTALIFLFSAEQVYYYEYKFSFLNDKKQEMTDEYFYNDIVSASTKSDVIKFSTAAYGDITQTVERFILTTSGGTSVGAILINMEGVQESINAMKNLMRSKKQQLK